MAQYQQPQQPYYQPPRPAETSVWAVLSLISGILGWLGLFGLGGLIAVITGHIGSSQIKNDPGRFTGQGMAKAGLILGYINIAFSLIGLCLLIVLPLMGISVSLCSIPFLENY